MRERRHLTGEGETFSLRLTNRTEKPVVIRATDSDSLKRSALLLYPDAGKTYDLRSKKSVTIESGNETTELKVALGTESYVKDKQGKVLPDEVELSSYPNPVREQGTIKYGLPEAKEVTLRIYDILGRRVATLASGQKEAGRHTAHLDAEQLSSGVYFGRLRAGEQTLTEKIVVVR